MRYTFQLQRTSIAGILVTFLLSAASVFAQPVHPRGMITSDELKGVRQKMEQPYFRQKLLHFQQQKDVWENPTLPAAGKDGYILEKWIGRCAFLYACTGEKQYAVKAAEIAGLMLKDTIVYNNPMVKGLTRAAVLKALTTAYDFCYDQWPEPLRKEVAASLLRTAFSMQSTMGFEANYALESNWMGVRYAAIMYALMVTDDKGKTQGKRAEADMLEWDVRERLRDHIKANMNPNGWSGESLGYHYYSWSFIAPALMAYEHNVIGKNKAIDMLAPSCRNAMAAHATVVAYIKGVDSFKAAKPDFSDDNVGVRPEFFLQALRLYPKEQVPYIKWMVEKMGYPETEEALFFAAAWIPDSIFSENPAQAGWLHAVEEAQGAIAFRNRFQDEQDIVAAFTTTAKRIRAHQSGDNLSFRMLGLDNIWVVGGGRTGLRAGQPTVFPTDTVSLTQSYKSGAIGQLLRYGFHEQGGGFAVGKGSCMDVENHQRYFGADYDASTGAAAVFVVRDVSSNGKIWRLTTPEWNKVSLIKNGFVLTAPNGATMQVQVVGSKIPVQVRTSKVKYNGTTAENASGIPYKGKRYPFITAVDIPMDASVTVVMSLQPAGSPHPPVTEKDYDVFTVGNKSYQISAMQ
jgi:hypothetical protein